MARELSGYSWTRTVALTRWGLSRLGGSWRRSPRHLTALSLPTARSS